METAEQIAQLRISRLLVDYDLAAFLELEAKGMRFGSYELAERRRLRAEWVSLTRQIERLEEQSDGDEK